MVNCSNEQGFESKSVAISPLAGEPAIAINGVPELTQAPGLPTQSDSSSSSESYSEPCFGEWMEGRKVRKMFDNEYYTGKVVKFDQEMKWYRVVYDDGDSEDLEWPELEEILLPVDITVPLEKLALRTFKHVASVKQPGGSSHESQKKYSRSGGSVNDKLHRSPTSANSKRKVRANSGRRGCSKRSLKVNTLKLQECDVVNVDVIEAGQTVSVESYEIERTDEKSRNSKKIISESASASYHEVVIGFKFGDGKLPKRESPTECLVQPLQVNPDLSSSHEVKKL